MSGIILPPKTVYRNLRQIEVAPELLARMCRGTFRVIANPVPDDARIVSSFYRTDAETFVVVVEHSSFAPIEVGQPIPRYQPPQIERIESEELT